MNFIGYEFGKVGLSSSRRLMTVRFSKTNLLLFHRNKTLRHRTDHTFDGNDETRREGVHPSSSSTSATTALTTSKVVLLRHGQSTWNKIPTFSGWCDVPLTDKGIMQAEGAAKVLKDRGVTFDLVFSSNLQRAYVSAEVVLEAMDDTSTPIARAWQLNERHYGALQGLAKDNPELISRYGHDKMKEWRRSMLAQPPPMDEWHPFFLPPPAPRTESLYDCQRRVVQFWNDTIVPAAAATSSYDYHHESWILVVAHANSLRALIAYLDNISHDDVPHIHIPNSVPCVYRIDTTTGHAIQQDASPLSQSRGYWMVSPENQERLVEKLGGNSEAFARSVFDAWDVDGNGVLSKEELVNGLSTWKRDANPAINALAGKIWEEVLKAGKSSTDDITLERFQTIAIQGSRRHNLPFFVDEESDIAFAA